MRANIATIVIGHPVDYLITNSTATTSAYLDSSMTTSFAREYISDTDFEQIVHAYAQPQIWHDLVRQPLVDTTSQHLKISPNIGVDFTLLRSQLSDRTRQLTAPSSFPSSCGFIAIVSSSSASTNIPNDQVLSMMLLVPTNYKIKWKSS